MSDPYSDVIFVSNWWALIYPIFWISLAMYLSGRFFPPNPKYGPADQLIDSLGPTAVCMFASGIITIALAYSEQFITKALFGFEIGFGG